MPEALELYVTSFGWMKQGDSLYYTEWHATDGALRVRINVAWSESADWHVFVQFWKYESFSAQELRAIYYIVDNLETAIG